MARGVLRTEVDVVLHEHGEREVEAIVLARAGVGVREGLERAFQPLGVVVDGNDATVLGDRLRRVEDADRDLEALVRPLR